MPLWSSGLWSSMGIPQLKMVHEPNIPDDDDPDDTRVLRGTDEQCKILLQLLERNEALLQEEDFVEQSCKQFIPDLRSRDREFQIKHDVSATLVYFRVVREEVGNRIRILHGLIAGAAFLRLHDSIQDALLSPSTAAEYAFDPKLLLRLTHAASSTSYDPHMGFKCGAWADCEPFEPDQPHEQVWTLAELRDHCHATTANTNWISLTSDWRFMIKFAAKSPRPQGCRVALVSAAAMRHLHVCFDRSDRLVERCARAASAPSAVRHAWPARVLARRWVPAQCVVATYGLVDFERVCAALPAGAGPATAELVGVPDALRRFAARDFSEQAWRAVLRRGTGAWTGIVDEGGRMGRGEMLEALERVDL